MSNLQHILKKQTTCQILDESSLIIDESNLIVDESSLIVDERSLHI